MGITPLPTDPLKSHPLRVDRNGGGEERVEWEGRGGGGGGGGGDEESKCEVSQVPLLLTAQQISLT